MPVDLVCVASCCGCCFESSLVSFVSYVAHEERKTRWGMANNRMTKTKTVLPLLFFCGCRPIPSAVVCAWIPFMTHSIRRGCRANVNREEIQRPFLPPIALETSNAQRHGTNNLRPPPTQSRIHVLQSNQNHLNLCGQPVRLHFWLPEQCSGCYGGRLKGGRANENTDPAPFAGRALPSHGTPISPQKLRWLGLRCLAYYAARCGRRKNTCRTRHRPSATNLQVTRGP